MRSGEQSLPQEGMQKLPGPQGWLKSDLCSIDVYNPIMFTRLPWLQITNLLGIFLLKALLSCPGI